MLGCVSSNGLITDTGNANDLTIIIDRRRSSSYLRGLRANLGFGPVVPESTQLDEIQDCGETHVLS